MIVSFNQVRMAQRRRTGYDPLVKLSKSLSWLLRHGAEKEGFQFVNGGFLFVDEILQKAQFRNFTEEDVKQVVLNNDKNRFALETNESARLMIRANQGHSLKVEDLELTPLTNADEFPTVVHGTTLLAWQSIRIQGLSVRNRNHIHFAVGEPGEDGVISGMRTTSEVVIYLDLKKILEDSIPVLKSVNNVILSPGNKDNIIPTHYFKQVLNRKTREVLQ